MRLIKVIIFSKKHIKNKVINLYSGFTLIEIMVALAIVSISGIALLTNIGSATRDLSVLDEKTVALNLAEYALNSQLVLPDYPDLGQEDQIIKQFDKEWRVDISISETPNEKVRRIDVMVSPISKSIFSDKPATILLSGFKVNLQ